MPKTPQNHNDVRVSRADSDQCIHAQTIMTFVVSRAHGDQGIRAQNQNDVRVSTAYGDQSIHAQTRMTFVVSRAYGIMTFVVSRAYGDQGIHAQTIMTFVVSRAYGDQSMQAQNHNDVRVSRAYGDQSIHAQTIMTFVVSRAWTCSSLSFFWHSSRKSSDGGLKTHQNYFLSVRLNPTIFKRNFCTMHETLAGVGKTGCATNREV